MTKQVQLSDKAYTLLKASKRDRESFSDVVLRLGRPRKSILDAFGSGTLGSREALRRFKAEDRAAERAREARRSKGRGRP